jgi:hypothetical protein
MVLGFFATAIGLCSLTEAITLNTRDRKSSMLVEERGNLTKPSAHGKAEAEINPNLRCPLAKSLSTWKGPSRSQLTLYMFGDSIVRKQFEGVCGTSGGYDVKDISVTATDPETKETEQTKIFTCEIPLPGESTLLAAFVGNHQAAPSRIDLLESMHEHLKPPDMLYFDGGMHFLHMMPYRVWVEYPQWLNYEAILNSFLQHPIVRGVPKLAFMTSHWICEEKYVGDYAQVINVIQHDPDEAVQSCTEYITDKFATKESKGNDATAAASMHTLTSSADAAAVASFDGGPKQQCKDSFLVSDGIKKLNDRAVSAIKQQSKQVGVVDCFTITKDQCEYTDSGDGRHYDDLVYKELSQFWETVQADAKGPSDISYLTEVMDCGINRWTDRCPKYGDGDPECA